MLILTRRVGESLFINDNIIVTVLGNSRSGQVRLGINAPDDVVILREELYIKDKNKLSARNGLELDNGSANSGNCERLNV